MRMSMNRYLMTGNPILDCLLGGIMTTLLVSLTSWLSRDNLVKFYQFLKNWWNKEKKPPQPSVKINEVKISSKRVTMIDQGQSYVQDVDLDEIKGDNSELICAFYWFLNQQVKYIGNSEFGINLNKRHDHRDEIVRDYSMMLRPNEPVDIDGFIISFNQTEKKPDEKQKPVKNREAEYDDRDEEFIGYTETHSVMAGNSLEQLIVIKSTKTTEEIVVFIKKIWEEYIKVKFPKVVRTRKEEKDPKWYFVRHPSGKYYDRYRLSSRVTFEDVFFPKKSIIIRRINDFLAGNTKFSRFTMLLHGEPGGGKTSFVKALHNHTDCHVITVKLSQFRTINSLMSLFHSENIKIDGRTCTIPINRRIYLLEDVDADGKIVWKRESSQDEENNDEKKQKVKEVVEEDDDIDIWTERIMKHHVLLRKRAEEREEMERQVTLATILNLLDGVLELNGCFIVLTTNHLDKLDPALIRDGRVTYKIELGKITQDDMKSMIQKFIPEYDSSKSHAELDPLIANMEEMMPCKFEQLVQHELDLAGVIANLKERQKA